MNVSPVGAIGFVSESRFRAMGSDIHLIIVDAPDALLDVAARRIEELERRWSRFRPDSEISRLNASAGTPVSVSDDTTLLVQRAIEAWRLTGGGFDPLLLDDVVRAGYDRSFDEIEPDRAAVERPPTADRFRLDRPDCTDIVINGNSVTIPAGSGFDPGGIGKGLAADLVATEIVDRGARGVCVNMGGDIRVLGSAPDGGGWTLSIEHPWSTAAIALVGMSGGAVATSSVLRRTWTLDGVSRHHLIDPSTGEPSTTDLGLASVIAGSAWEAEVLAKAVLLRGSERAFDLLDEWTAAVVVARDGGVVASPLFSSFLGGVPLTATVRFDHDVETSGS